MKLPFLLLPVALMTAATSAQALGLTEMKRRTAFIAERYLQIWSSSNVSPEPPST